MFSARVYKPPKHSTIKLKAACLPEAGDFQVVVPT